MSQAPGLSGTPVPGQVSIAARRASWASSSARPTSRTIRARPAMTLANSILQTASIALCVADAVTAIDRSRRLEALADCQNISLAVLKPGGFRAAGGRDAVLHPDPGHVVFLEHHAPGFELGHFGLDVAHLPERLAGFRRPRVFRRVHEDFGAAAFVDHAAGVFLLRRKSKGLLVEIPRPREIGNRDVSANRRSSQHDQPP